VIIPFTTLTYSPLISPLELEETMNLGTETNSKTKKVKLNLSKPFNGKCENLKMFLQDSQMYILINAETYDTNLKKIAFMLSLMRCCLLETTAYRRNTWPSAPCRNRS